MHRRTILVGTLKFRPVPFLPAGVSQFARRLRINITAIGTAKPDKFFIGCIEIGRAVITGSNIIDQPFLDPGGYIQSPPFTLLKILQYANSQDEFTALLLADLVIGNLIPAEPHWLLAS